MQIWKRNKRNVVKESLEYPQHKGRVQVYVQSLDDWKGKTELNRVIRSHTFRVVLCILVQLSCFYYIVLWPTLFNQHFAKVMSRVTATGIIVGTALLFSNVYTVRSGSDRWKYASRAPGTTVLATLPSVHSAIDKSVLLPRCTTIVC